MIELPLSEHLVAAFQTIGESSIVAPIDEQPAHARSMLAARLTLFCRYLNPTDLLDAAEAHLEGDESALAALLASLEGRSEGRWHHEVAELTLVLAEQPAAVAPASRGPT